MWCTTSLSKTYSTQSKFVLTYSELAAVKRMQVMSTVIYSSSKVHITWKHMASLYFPNYYNIPKIFSVSIFWFEEVQDIFQLYK